MSASFEDTYPHIAEWVQVHGWIEIGQDEYSSSFVRAFDIGGLVWEGKSSYNGVVRDLKQHNHRSRVVFLDPDTGIAPKVPKLEHVTIQDIQRIWEALEPDDWLAVYQHAYRSEGWPEVSKRKFGRACDVEEVRTFQASEIAKDVAVFAARKTRT